MTWFQFGLICSGCIVGGFVGYLVSRWARRDSPPSTAASLSRVWEDIDKRFAAEKGLIEDRLRALERSHLQLKGEHERSRKMLEQTAKDAASATFKELVAKFKGR